MKCYMQNEADEWVQIANKGFSSGGTGNPEGCAAKRGLYVPPIQMELQYSADAFAHFFKVFRRLEEGWRTPHGPLRRRMRQRAKRFIAKRIYEHAVRQCVDSGFSDRDARIFIKRLILVRKIEAQYGGAKN